MDSINMVLSQSDYNLFLSLLKIAPTLLELAQDVAKKDEKTALHGISDANLETQAEPAFTETNHTDFILNSPGEYKSPRRGDELVPLNAVFQALGSIQTQISELATQSGYIHNGNRVHLQELVKQVNATNNSLNNISNRVQALSKDIAGIQTQGKATDASWTNVKAQYSSIDLQLNNGFNESINAIDALRTGVNFKFNDEMADHLGGIFTELKAIKEKVSDWSRPNDIKRSTFNPMYPVSRADYQKDITDPMPTQQTLPVHEIFMSVTASKPSTVKEDVENALAGIWNSPVSHHMTSNIMMEDVFKLADKLDAEDLHNG